MDLQDLVKVLWKKKWILIIVPIIAASFAFAVRYYGEWQFKSEGQLATGLTVSDEVDKSNLNPYEIQVTFNNLIETIKSRSIVSLVSYRALKHDLEDSVETFRRIDPEVAKQKGYGDPYLYKDQFVKILNNKLDSLTLLNPNKPYEKLILTYLDLFHYDYESIEEELQVARLNQSDFLTVSFTSENAKLSAFIVNTLCEEFIRYYTSSKTFRSGESIESLESIVQKRKEFLDDKLIELKNFRSSSDVINSDLESEARVGQLKTYENDIAAEQQHVRGLELTLVNLNTRIRDGEVGTGSKSNDQIVRLRKRINEVNERYIRGGQTDNALLDTLTSLRSQLDATMQRVNENKVSVADLNLLRNKREETMVELEIAREKLASLNTIYNQLRYSMGDLAGKESVAKILEKEVEMANEEYSTALSKLNTAREKFLTNKVAIKQILVAEPATEAESRKTMIFMILSAMMGFAISAAVIVGLALMDKRIKNSRRFKYMSRMKLAGILPFIGDYDFNWELNSSMSRHQARINDEIRKIRFEIESQRARVLLITSTKPGEGKSFFTIALAFSFSLLKKRVLIIDTNLRNNTLTKTLVAKPNLNLLLDNFSKNVKLLTAHGTDGETPNEANIPHVTELISKTQNERIDIIGNKMNQLPPSEIIPGGDFKVLIEWLKGYYDYILMEGPNLNQYSDAKELVKFVDLVVPVFSAESTIDGADSESLSYLKSLQSRLGPAVLNNVKDSEEK